MNDIDAVVDDFKRRVELARNRPHLYDTPEEFILREMLDPAEGVLSLVDEEWDRDLENEVETLESKVRELEEERADMQEAVNKITEAIKAWT